MVRSTKADKARQLNAAHQLLKRNTALSEAAQSLSRSSTCHCVKPIGIWS
jgi:hypothetical protein